MTARRQRRLRNAKRQRTTSAKTDRRHRRQSRSVAVAAAGAVCVSGTLVGATEASGASNPPSVTTSASAHAAPADLTPFRARRVADIKRGPKGSAPAFFTKAANTTFFIASGDQGRELWKTDGTAAGTTQVKDLLRGRTGSSPGELTRVGNKLYFTALRPAPNNYEAAGVGEIWRSNGTKSGTVRVTKFPPVGYPTQLTAFGGSLFFSACNDYYYLDDCEPWSLRPGQKAKRLKDFNPNVRLNGDRLGSDPEGFTVVGDQLFFSGNVGANYSGRSTHLWRTDGTASGSALVRDMFHDTAMYERPPVALGGQMFFTAREAAAGDDDLWLTDGTGAGTSKLADFEAGAGDPSPSQLTRVGTRVFFAADRDDAQPGSDRELWVSDGTPAGTEPVLDIRPGAQGSDPKQLTAVGDVVYFAASSDASEQGELWRSDGTPAGTSLVKRIGSGGTAGAIRDITPFKGHVLFTAAGAGKGRELWISDGTGAGTRLLQDIAPGGRGSNPRHLTVIDGRVFFAADDGRKGAELWVYEPDNTFGVAKGKVDRNNATVRVKVAVQGPGFIKIRPRKGSPIKGVGQGAGGQSTRLLLVELKRRGMKQLRKQLRQGAEVAKLDVPMNITYKPRGGTARTVKRTFRFKLKR